MFKSKKKEAQPTDSPVYVLEESEIEISEDASKDILLYKEHHPELTSFSEDLFYHAYAMCEKHIPDKISQAISVDRLNMAKKYQESLDIVNSEHEDKIKSLKESYEDKLTLMNRDYTSNLENIKKKWFDDSDRLKDKINELVKQAADEAEKAKVIPFLQEKIKLLESSYNTKALQAGSTSTAPLLYDYKFNFNMKAPDFDACFADGWEPVSLISNNNGICGCFRKLKLAVPSEPEVNSDNKSNE